MSRNLRHKADMSPAKKTSRRSSKTTDNSSDDDYDGVDLISDSEEDEPDVEVAEEQAIIESAEEDEDEDDDAASTPRPTIEDDQSSWEGFPIDTTEDALAEVPFFDDHLSRMHAPDHDTEATVWASRNHATDDDPEPRRVRFNLSDNSSIASDNDDNLYPDLFMDQESLAPSFRRRIENDDDEQNPSSEDGSYWDFEGAEKPAVPEGEENGSDDSAGSSGYETDAGETTEEEAPPEIIPRKKYLRPRSLLRRQSTDSGSEEEITINRRVPPRAGRGPKLGSWVHNDSRPFAVINSDGNRLYMFRARPNRRYSQGDIRQPGSVSAQDSEVETGAEQLSPMISNSANIMMSAIYNPTNPTNPFMNTLGAQTLGPPEAFYAFANMGPNGEVLRDSTSSFDEEDLDDEELWDVDDFINFGEDSSDEEGAEGETAETPRPTTATSDEQTYSNILNPDIVGAFRKNQQKHKLMTRYNATVDSLVFAGPYSSTSLRGIKDGRIAHAATPITPMRKKRSLPMDSSPLAAHSNKRKFSGEEKGHKRSKSLV